MKIKLVQLIAQLLQLSQVHRAAHWMVKGSAFHSLHGYYESLYHKSDEWADAVAERALFLGGQPPLTLSEVSSLAPEITIDAEAQYHSQLTQVHDYWKTLQASVLDVLAFAEKEGDRATVSLLDGMLSEIELEMWKQQKTLA